jgi:hypothetical protein
MKATFAPLGGAFSCGPATKKNPERCSLGVPELSLRLGSRLYGGGCRGMGCYTASPKMAAIISVGGWGAIWFA